MSTGVKRSFIGLALTGDRINKTLSGRVYQLVGRDYEDWIGVEPETGRVYSISAEDGERVFVNSSLTLLEAFVDYAVAALDLYGDYDEERRRKQVEALRKAFAARDFEAVEDGGWWDYVLEQLEDGLL